MFFYFVLSFCAGMIILFSGVPFICSFFGFSVGCCAALLALTFFYMNTASSPPVFQVGYTTNNWQACATNCYDPATRSEDCMVSICVESPQCALAAGRTYYLLLHLLLVVFIAHSFGFCCRFLCGSDAILLCNGRFWDGFTSGTSASLWPVTSRDHP